MTRIGGRLKAAFCSILFSSSKKPQKLDGIGQAGFVISHPLLHWNGKPFQQLVIQPLHFVSRQHAQNPIHMLHFFFCLFQALRWIFLLHLVLDLRNPGFDHLIQLIQYSIHLSGSLLSATEDTVTLRQSRYENRTNLLVTFSQRSFYHCIFISLPAPSSC